jgi:tetratricopeptide (TPR) repeat protein
MRVVKWRALGVRLCILATVVTCAIVVPASAQNKRNAFEKDLAECRYEAMKYSPPPSEISMAMILQKAHEEELILRCMEARGYQRRIDVPAAPSEQQSSPGPRNVPQTTPQATANSPKASDEYYELGLAYFKKGQLEKAIQALDQSIELDHENSDAFFQLALAYHQLGDSDKALQVFRGLEKIDRELAIKLFNIIKTPTK